MTIPTTLNPYHVAGPIHDPDYFFGRGDELRRILEPAWQHHQSTNIVGEARSGKTSLLFHILDANVRAKLVPDDRHSVYVYLNPELCPDRGTFYNLALQGVAREYPDLLQLSEDPLTEGDVLAHLRALLPRHLVLLIDNFEYMCDCEHFTSEFFDFLRGLATHTEFYITMVVASRKHIYELCPNEVLKSGFANIFADVRLGAFTVDEFDEFIEQTSSRSGAPISEVREEIRNLAGYYPYLAQMACSHLYDMWRRKGRLHTEDVAIVRRQFERDARIHFQRIWLRHLSAPEKQVLTTLAQGKEIVAETTLDDGDGRDRPIEAVLDDLEAKGYLVDGEIAPRCLAEFIRSQLDVSRPGDAVAAHSQPKDQGIRIDQVSGEIYIEGDKLKRQLSPLQHRLLMHLWQHKGCVCKKDDLAVTGWNTAEGVTDEALAQQVARLRALLGKGRRYIVTVNRWGYKLVDAPEQAESAPEGG